MHRIVMKKEIYVLGDYVRKIISFFENNKEVNEIVACFSSIVSGNTDRIILRSDSHSRIEEKLLLEDIEKEKNKKRESAVKDFGIDQLITLFLKKEGPETLRKILLKDNKVKKFIDQNFL